MKYIILGISIACIPAVHASDQSLTAPQQNFNACWCKPVPCWGQSCESAYPTCCLSKCNQRKEVEFRKIFYAGGPWDESGNRFKKCCVEYLRHTSPYNCTELAAVPAAPIIAALVFAICTGFSIDTGVTFGCCDSTNTCINDWASCANAMFCPFVCDVSKGVCCPPNVYNILTCLGEITCSTSPFCTWAMEFGLLRYLSNPKNWSKSKDDVTDIPYEEIRTGIDDDYTREE